MRRTSLAALLAAPLLLVFPGSASAHPPKQCFSPFGGGGICLGMFSKLHQHGPLFNYGPYYGYPPFEPYGPWNAYLQYNPWYYGDGGGGGAYGWNHNLFHGRLGGHGCGHFGRFLHTNWLHGGWFRGHDCADCGRGGLFGGHCWGKCGRGHVTGGTCDGCTTASSTTDPLTRFAGAGSPTQAASFYAGLPTIAAVTPAGGVR